MCHLYALRTSGRARSVNHIGSAVRSGQTLEWTCRFHVFHHLFSQQHFGFAVLNHVADAVFGIIHIDRHVGSSSLLGGQYGNQELFNAIHLDSYKIVGLHSLTY